MLFTFVKFIWKLGLPQNIDYEQKTLMTQMTK
jgi:hypothetical protein